MNRRPPLLRSFFWFAGAAGLSVTLIFILICVAEPATAQSINLDFGDGGEATGRLVQIIALITVLSLAPSLLVMVTSFIRILIVLSFLRTAMGTMQTPPNQVLIAIALFLTFFIMAPTFETVYDDSISPYLDGEITADNALIDGKNVIKNFLVQNTRISDLNMFSDMVGISNYESPEAVPLSVLLPAFITSELKTAFQIGFLLFLPFLVIDMVIASILMSLGMMMLSPMLVAMPFKLLLFVLVDGWAMTVGSLVATYSIGG